MLGYIRFGAERTKTVGAASPGYCDYCGNQSVWYLIKARRWVDFLLIPIVPTESARYRLACEICGASAEISDDLASEAKDMIDRTTAYRSGELDEEIYLAHVDRFAERMNPEPSKDRDSEPDAEDIRGIQ